MRQHSEATKHCTLPTVNKYKPSIMKRLKKIGPSRPTIQDNSRSLEAGTDTEHHHKEVKGYLLTYLLT